MLISLKSHKTIGKEKIHRKESGSKTKEQQINAKRNVKQNT